MKKKKNRFFLFCFSFLPGVGELYLGFMKMGISLLSLFAFSIILALYSNIGVMGFVIAVIWVYGFFHANNLGALSDEEFYRMEDEYLFDIGGKDLDSVKDSFMGKYQKALAVLLIVLGVSMLWQTFCGFLRHIVGDTFYYQYISTFTNALSRDVPRAVVGIAIIWFGVKLIKGKKAELDNMENMDSAKQFEQNAQVEQTAQVEQNTQVEQAGQTAQTEEKPL